MKYHIVCKPSRLSCLLSLSQNTAPYRALGLARCGHDGGGRWSGATRRLYGAAETVSVERRRRLALRSHTFTEPPSGLAGKIAAGDTIVMRIDAEDSAAEDQDFYIARAAAPARKLDREERHGGVDIPGGLWVLTVRWYDLKRRGGNGDLVYEYLGGAPATMFLDSVVRGALKYVTNFRPAKAADGSIEYRLLSAAAHEILTNTDL